MGEVILENTLCKAVYCALRVPVGIGIFSHAHAFQRMSTPFSIEHREIGIANETTHLFNKYK